MFPKDVPKGGLTLGEIRTLSRALIEDCEKCGRITKNYLSKNESDLGWLDFNWKKSAICQDNCIDPEKDLKTVNSTSADDEDENGGMYVITRASWSETDVSNPVWVLASGPFRTLIGYRQFD